MILVDIVNRNVTPQAWGEGEHIPWDDPYFCEKMLKEHLDHEEDYICRSFKVIDSHVDWIHNTLLNGKPSKILALKCGPGLYTNRLAKLGHECVGIDVSSPAITIARENAQKDDLPCTYIEHSIYGADFGSDYGLIMMISGDFNAFNPMDVYEFFGKAWMALGEGGRLLLEPYTFIALKKMGQQKPEWYSAKEGVFTDKPYLCLMENRWNDANRTLTKRWYLVDTNTAKVRYIAQCYQAYTREYLKSLLEKRDYSDVVFHPGLNGKKEKPDDDFLIVSAVKSGNL